MLNGHTREFAIVTGASTGIGRELARCCAAHNYDLLLVADELEISDVCEELRSFDVNVEPVVADLATQQGVKAVVEAIGGRRVDALLANAGRGLGHAFLDQDFRQVIELLNVNVTGTLMLIHEVGQLMRSQRAGKILVTGSIAGVTPGAFQAVYHGTQALLESFSFALREELKHSGVTVTCLMPGTTETEFFKRAELMDTKEGVSKKQSAEDVARAGFSAMVAGDASAIPGLANKLRAAFSHLVPNTFLAEQSRKHNEPSNGP